MPSIRPARLISGGQTGADRAGLDVAIHLGIPWGGWAPRGWLAEDAGKKRIPIRYHAGRGPWPPGDIRNCGLVDPGPITGEMRYGKVYRERTELNVRDCDAALLFVWDSVTPGTKLTQRLLKEAGKPFFCEHVGRSGEIPPPWFSGFIAEHAAGKTLLIAGSRESKSPGIYAYTYTILREALR